MKTRILALAVLSTLLYTAFLFKKEEPVKNGKNETPATVETSAPSVKETSLPKTPLPGESDRRGFYREWLSAAESIAQKTGDKQAIAITEFIKSSMLLAEPYGSFARFLEGGRSDQKFFFALIMMRQGDGEVSPAWHERLVEQDKSGANFAPDGPIMVIKSHIAFSETMKGIILLHEGRHAREFLTRQYDWQHARTFCEEERDTHDFQNKLMSKLFGSKYDDLVLKLSHEIEDALREKGYTPDKGIAHRMRKFDEFNSFLPTQSKLEEDFRDTSIWIHACFIMLERSLGKDAPNQKALMLFSLYKEKGLLPD